jgi:hypothetical protein
LVVAMGFSRSSLGAVTDILRTGAPVDTGA